MKKFALLIVLFVLLFGVLITGCSSSGSGDDQEDENPVTPPVDPPTIPPEGTPNPVTGYDLNLATGSYWTFWWDWSDKATWMSSYDSGSDIDTGTGYLTITLGDETVIAGKSVYTVILSGDIPEPWQTNPFWSHIGSDVDGLYASADGYTLKSIVDAATGRVSNEFFRRWNELAEEASPILQDGYFTATNPVSWSTNVHTTSWGSEYNDTISIPGYDPIAGDEYNRTAVEYLKPGIGPIGCSDYEYLYDREDSSNSSTYITKWAFNLVSTNLSADDGFVLPAPVWERAEMPDTREDPSVVLIGDTRYILLGGVLYDGSRTMYKQTGDTAWVRCADFPVDFSGLYGYGTASAYGGKIYAFVKQEPSYKTAVYAYDPASDSWSTAYAPGTLNTHPASSVVNGTSIYFMSHDSSGHSFDPATGTITSYVALSSKISYPRLAADENGIYMIAQVNLYGDTYSTALWTCDADGWTEYTWSMDMKRRCKAALAVHNGRLWVFGGADKTVMSAPLSGSIPGSWTTHSNMLYGGSLLFALPDGDRIRVYGSNDGKAIEIYNPAVDD